MVNLFKILPDGEQLRSLLCINKQKEQSNPQMISELFTILKASDCSFTVCSKRYVVFNFFKILPYGEQLRLLLYINKQIE